MRFNRKLVSIYWLAMTAIVATSSAFSTSVKLQCPSVETLKANGIFIKTQSTALPMLKQIYTDNYQHDNRLWQTMFVFYMERDNTANPLTFGQGLFNKAKLGNKPASNQDQSRFSCSYQTDQGVFLQAFTMIG